MDAPGFWLQALGLILTGFGLGLTWWQWSQRRMAWSASMSQLPLRRKSQPVTLTATASIEARAEVFATAFVTRPGTPPAERMTLIEEEQGRQDAANAASLRALSKDIEKVVQAHAAEQEENQRRIDAALDSTKDLVAKANLSGIWWAIGGVGLSLAGLVAATAWPNWHF